MACYAMFAATISLGLMAAACFSGPDPKTFGGQLQSQGGQVSAIGEKWSKGEAKIRKGEELVREGEQLKLQAEQEYRQFDATRQPPGAPPASKTNG